MRTGKLTRRRIIVLLAVALAIIVALSSALIRGHKAGKNVTQSLLAPFDSALSALTRTAERFYNYVFQFESLEAENAYLKKRVATLEDEIRSIDTLQRENERLRALANLLKEHEDYDPVSAYIISWDSSNWRNTFTIGKGTNSGVSEGMCAVTEQGQVVGIVTDCGSNWATVTTILDSSLQISATLSSSGYNGIVQGAHKTDKENQLRMDYLSTEAVIRNNDQVVTTGSTLYPRGLILGYVVDAGLDGTGVAKYAVIEPAANFNALEQVFVITNYVNE
ncbi:MAG: rod shape-determining protein MreC [Ruminococcaceae bacterium]|nr:rod shape-determining protein MreC [Oscillospiraceae bacterium]